METNTKRNVAIITIIYVLTQGMLLVLTGRWWDDWCQYGQSMSSLLQQSIELGRPSAYVITGLMKQLPEYGYRIITFFAFYATTLFFYGILNNTEFLSERDCTIITLIYIAIPVNDARVMLAVFPYTIGNFFFFAGFYALTEFMKMHNEKFRVVRRIFIICLFAMSFVLNSNLVLYVTVLLYIGYFLAKKGELNIAWKYMDFILLPIVFFVCKNIMFPVSGAYEGYNQLTIKGMIWAVFHILQSTIVMFCNVLWTWSKQIDSVFVCIGAMLLIKRMLKKRAGTINEVYIIDSNRKSVYFCTLTFLIGIVILCASLFPYIAIRNNVYVAITGTFGRDAILVPAGAAICVYSIVELICNRATILKKYFYALIIILGILHFNSWYTMYQLDYYRQLCFTQHLIEERKNLSSSKNILYITDSELEIGTTRFYTLNGNAEEAWKTQDKLFLNGHNDIEFLKDKELLNSFVNSGYCHMNDYVVEQSEEIDAIVCYSNKLNSKETLRLKFLQILEPSVFYNTLYQYGNIEVVFPEDEKFVQLLEE